MTLEELKLNAEQKRLLAKDYHEKLNEQFHSLFMGLVNSHVGVEVTTYLDVNPWDLKADHGGSYDSIEVNLDRARDKKHLNFSIYIKADKIEINNCCCGNWSAQDLYCDYVQMMYEVMLHSNMIREFDDQIDRSIFLDSIHAQTEVEDEERRLIAEEDLKLEEECRKKLVVGTYYGKSVDSGNRIYRIDQVMNKTLLVTVFKYDYNYDTHTYNYYPDDSERVKIEDVLWSLVHNGSRIIDEKEMNIVGNGYTE